jgi:4-hydroxy-3-methylbut-2-enyl diphosphate reductase
MLERSGIKKIDCLGRGNGKTLLVRAHGTSRKLFQDALSRRYTILDATCPMVKDIHRIALRMEKQGYTIVIIGDKNHDEVKGIKGQLVKPPIVIENPHTIPWKRLKKSRKVAVVSQSTQTEDNAAQITASLRRKIKNVLFFNTICAPTKIKQRKMKTMPGQNEVMLVAGSKTSANTRRLYELSKSLNPRTFWVQSSRDIRKRWFKGVRRVGITAGASTPDAAIQAIVRRIKELRLRKGRPDAAQQR